MVNASIVDGTIWESGATAMQLDLSCSYQSLIIQGIQSICNVNLFSD